MKKISIPVVFKSFTTDENGRHEATVFTRVTEPVDPDAEPESARPVGRIWTDDSAAIDFGGTYIFNFTPLTDDSVVERNPGVLSTRGNIATIRTTHVEVSNGVCYRGVQVEVMEEDINVLDDHDAEVTVLANLVLTSDQARDLRFGQQVHIEVVPA